MCRIRNGILVNFCSLVLMWVSSVSAQDYPNAYSAREMAIARVDDASRISPLSVDNAFGDSLNLYNGSVQFEHVDISLPSNNDLKVELRRKFSVADHRGMVNYGNFPGFSDWDLDVPYLTGTFALSKGWVVAGPDPLKRCSAPNSPPGTTLFSEWRYWNGYWMHMPGNGDQLLMGNPDPVKVPAPTDGNSYPWVTKDFWRVRCLAGTKNGHPGEAFLLTSPQGYRYYMDHVITAPAFQLVHQLGLGGAPSVFPNILDRVTVYFMASRVEDQFGNWVNYNWSGDKLLSISSSDGRAINLTYSGSILISATAGSQIWRYSYQGGRLSNVLLPDGSGWSFSSSGSQLIYYGENEREHSVIDCMHGAILSPPMGSFGYTVTSPSGGVGVFNFVARRHFNSGTFKMCESFNIKEQHLIEPNYSDNFTLARKTISGAGLPAMIWNYAYGEVYFAAFSDQCGPSGDPGKCPQTKQQVVTGPNGYWERYEYGIMKYVNRGQLLKKEVGTGSGNILRTEIYSYIPPEAVSSQLFPKYAGSDFRQHSDSSGLEQRPIIESVISQQGRSFSSKVATDCVGTTYCFDVFARPTKLNKGSLP